MARKTALFQNKINGMGIVQSELVSVCDGDEADLCNSGDNFPEGEAPFSKNGPFADLARVRFDCAINLSLQFATGFWAVGRYHA